MNKTIGTDLQICVSSGRCKEPQEPSKVESALSEGFARNITVTLNSSDDFPYVTLNKVSVTTANN